MWFSDDKGLEGPISCENPFESRVKLQIDCKLRNGFRVIMGCGKSVPSPVRATTLLSRANAPSSKRF